jgi:hypothetical protein
MFDVELHPYKGPRSHDITAVRATIAAPVTSSRPVTDRQRMLHDMPVISTGFLSPGMATIKAIMRNLGTALSYCSFSRSS